MTASAVRAGKAYVEIATERSAFDKGIAAVQSSMRRLAAVTNTIGATMGRGFGAATGALQSFAGRALSLPSILAGAAAGAGVGMIAQQFADAAGAVDDMSQRTGLAAEEIGGLSYAAKLSGTSIETVEKAIRKMQTTIGGKSGMSASQGFTALADTVAAIDDPTARAAKAMEVFNQSGDKMADTVAAIDDPTARAAKAMEVFNQSGDKMAKMAGESGMSVSQQFLALADTVAAIDDPTARAAKAIEIFGKSGAELVPLLSGGSAGIAKLAKEANALGVTMSATDAAAGAALGDTIDRLWMSMSGLTNQIGAALAPALTWLGDQMVGIISYAANWIKETRRLAQSFSQLQQWGSVAIMGLEVAFREGYQGIYELWTDLTTWMVTSTVDAIAGVANIFAGIPTAIMNGFGTAITWLTGAWDSTVNYIAKKLLYLYSLFDKSVDYEAAAKQMDTDAAGRAASRQKSLDDANARRNADLAAGNASRLAMADNVNQGIRADGSQRKSEYESRIRELGSAIAATMANIRSEADAIDAQAAATQAEKQKATETKIPDPLAVAGAVAVKASGTFSGFAAGAIGAGTSAFDRMVDNGKKANDLLKQIAANTAEADNLAFDA